jgi:predicted metal-dependent hydrolase
VEIFSRLNRQFFEGKLPRLRLGWTPRDSRSILGHYDSAHRTISVSRWLDRPSVPQQVVEYLVFHEMLHVLYPITRRGQRRVVHPPEFLAAEKKFPQHEAARRWLKRKAASLGN